MISLAEIATVLPQALAERFKADTEAAPKLVTILNRFADWFENSGVPFFQTYTDHSVKHSLDVFRSGCGFLSEKSFSVITTKDICIFAASCFLHDAGMHLTELHFQRLIIYDALPLSSFDSGSWHQLWQDFLEESRRYSAKRSIQVFGDEKGVTSIPSDISEYTNKHRLLIGEFLRSNHPRLGHDLALGLDDVLGLSPLLDLFDAEDRDLIGLVSRSHGFPLRSFFPYISSRYHLRDFNGTHIVFLMCLLGIADFAQIDSYRAPKTKLKMIHVTSPLSRREWRVHQSVRNITSLHDDPESFYVDALPESVEDFLRLQDWLVGIQEALDLCWAILGEVYGRFTQEGLQNLSLTVRRVRSSIFEQKRRFSYVPELIRFSVAETEMLSLLLEPLYGDNPGYGVRELLQNAVDAVREARFLDVQSPRENEVRLRLQITERDAVFSIEDLGIGMSLKTIKSFFLRAGASFRTSSEWKKRFVSDLGTDEIVRSGRFGVGALAAFIIGPNMEVRTRHYSEPRCWTFVGSLLDDQIEIRPVDGPVGTIISIIIPPEKVNDLTDYIENSEDYFEFDDVSVVVEVVKEGNSAKKILRPKTSHLYTLQNDLYESILIDDAWRRNRVSRPDFVNGIAITPIGEHRYRNRLVSLGSLTIEPIFCDASHHYKRSKDVSCSVVDRNQRAPLNLARNEFTRPDFDLSNLIAELAFKEIVEILPAINSYHQTETIETNFFLIDRSSFVFNARGICLLDVFVLKSTSIKTLVALPSDARVSAEILNAYPEVGFVFGVGISGDMSSTSCVHYLRQARQERSRISLFALFNKHRIDEILAIASTPGWMREYLTERSSLISRDQAHVTISFDEFDDEILKFMHDLVKLKIVDNPICLKIGPDGWFNNLWKADRHNSEVPLISEKWIEHFEGLGFFAVHSS